MLVAQVLACGPTFSILVVDDASPDGTGRGGRRAGAREFPGRVQVMHRTGKRGLGRSYVDALSQAVDDGRRHRLPDGRRLLARPAVPARPGRAASTEDGYDLVIGSRYLHGVSVVNWPLRRLILSTFANRYVRGDHRPAGARLHERLPLLATRSAGHAAAAPVRLGRLCVPRRDAVRGDGRGVPHRRGADHLRRAARGAVEDVAGRDLRVGASCPGGSCCGIRRGAARARLRLVLTVRLFGYARHLPRTPAGLSIFFPAYNDSGTIASMVVSALLAARALTPDHEVIVVNDGSRDDTPQIARRTGPHVSRRCASSTTRRTAATAAPCAAASRRRPRTYVFYTDGDAQYDPSRSGAAVAAAGARRRPGQRLQDQPRPTRCTASSSAGSTTTR